jgi:hypothetical protein
MKTLDKSGMGTVVSGDHRIVILIPGGSIFSI